jgi:hypothetical protein
VSKALSGNAAAALTLGALLGGDQMWKLLMIALVDGQRNGAFRNLLDAAWTQQHDMIMQRAGSARSVRRLFRSAGFSPPSFLPAKFRVFRGVNRMPTNIAKQGISWTLSYDLACWFALREGGIDNMPKVLASTVLKEEVVYCSNLRWEAEVITSRRPHATVDRQGIDKWCIATERLMVARLTNGSNWFRPSSVIPA